MRESSAPWFKTLPELVVYIDDLATGTHDYGTCVYAMSLAATAAFNFIAGTLGCTGFQSQCADMDVLRRTRDYKGPFMIIKAEDLLYPQYDLHMKLTSVIKEWQPWARTEAQKLLREAKDKTKIHPDVLARWEQLANQVIVSEKK